MIRGLFDLWPLILIIIGLSFIFKKEMLDTILWAAFIAILIIYSFFVKDPGVDIDGRGNMVEDEEVSIEMEDRIEKASLDLDVGAAKFKVDSADFEFIRLEQNGAFEYRIDSKDTLEKVYVKNKDNFLDNRKQSSLFLYLNKDIGWEMNYNVGAISGDLNLKDIKVDKLSVDVGAGDLKFTMGDKNDFTSMDIDAGASNIVLNLPTSIGLKIDLDGALKSSNLEDLDLIKLEKNKFESKNYETSTSKYEIDIDMGVGNFEINYY